MVTEYLRSGRADSSFLDQLRFGTRSATAAPPASVTAVRCPVRGVRSDRAKRNLVATSVLSRQPQLSRAACSGEVRANYLASPPLVVAYALAGSHHHRPDGRSRSGEGTHGEDVYLKDIWPSAARRWTRHWCARRCKTVHVRPSKYGATSSKVDEQLARPVRCPRVRPLLLVGRLDLRAPPSVFRGHARGRAGAAVTDIAGARVLALLGDSRHHRPHLAGGCHQGRRHPPGKLPHRQRRRAPRLQQRTARRRGNHEVMMRGTFANVRLRNLLAPGTSRVAGHALPARTARRCRSMTLP